MDCCNEFCPGRVKGRGGRPESKQIHGNFGQNDQSLYLDYSWGSKFTEDMSNLSSIMERFFFRDYCNYIRYVLQFGSKRYFSVLMKLKNVRQCQGAKSTERDFDSILSTGNCYLLVLCIQEGYSGVTRNSNKEVCATAALEIFKYRNVLCKGSFQTVENFYFKCTESVCIIAKELKYIIKKVSESVSLFSATV